MYFESFADFIAMGGHGFYVWLCYAIVLFSLIAKLIVSRGGVERSKKELDRYYRQRARRENISEGGAFSDPDVSSQSSSEVN